MGLFSWRSFFTVSAEVKKWEHYELSEKPDPNEMIADGRLKEANYEENSIGTIYDDPPCMRERDWEINSAKMPYLSHIKNLQTAWPHLRHLKQWMEVTTAPDKWQLLESLPEERLRQIRKERATRTNVAAFDFVPDEPAPKEQAIKTRDELESHLDTPIAKDATRLYVVEDLSRDVIELLGFKLDIDPLFFREHINDFLWYNTRDPWVELPDLDIVSRSRPYFRLTYMQPRYFQDEDSFKKASRQAGLFNVLRRLDVDSEHKSRFDNEQATVALVRSKVSMWIREATDDQPAIGVLLIDPSIKEGNPLWNGYRPFKNSPTPSDKTPFEAAPKTTLFENLLFWIRHTSQEDVNAIQKNPKAMAFRALQIICAEWLTLSRYITARLGQIEWEIERPDFRIEKNDGNDTVNFNTSLQKLHTWRRRLPLYRDMVSETRTKLFPDDGPGTGPTDCIGELHKDFKIVAGHINDLLSRTERIAAVATAVTAIEESRRAIEQNKALGRLTYLAVIFAPLSFVSSFFSMSENVAELSQTIWIYFCVAVPISALAFLLVDKNWTDNMMGVYRKTSAAKEKVKHHHHEKK
ncbi:hypothetical protein GGR53DRAFT_340036 [Hypoxylon sp. FL1150]|nr:hypothetical protein GGR53DRAFT_340036 [Hypoxylon sp. FL1150]